MEAPRNELREVEGGWQVFFIDEAGDATPNGDIVTREEGERELTLINAVLEAEWPPETGNRIYLMTDYTSSSVWWETGGGRHDSLVHPFDDPIVLAGQGTVGLEFAQDAPPLTDVLVSIGGGALISGVAVAIKALVPDVRIWGVETEGADAMARALAAGRPVDIAPSSIASTLSAPHVSQLTLDHVRALVDEVFVVSDAEAVRGMVAFAEEAKLWVEPATGCLVPAVSKVIERADNDVSLGFVVCGGNVSQRDVRGWVDRLL